MIRLLSLLRKAPAPSVAEAATILSAHAQQAQRERRDEMTRLLREHVRREKVVPIIKEICRG